MAPIELFLKVMQSLDLREGVPDSVATHLERTIRSIAETLRKKKVIPENDPLRFEKDGNRIPEEIFNEILDDVIESWPLYKGDWNGGKKNYQTRL